MFGIDFILSCTSRVISVNWFGGVVLEPEDEAHLVLRQGEVRLQGSSTELRATQLTDTVLSEIVKTLSVVKVTTKFLGTREKRLCHFLVKNGIFQFFFLEQVYFNEKEWSIMDIFIFIFAMGISV